MNLRRDAQIGHSPELQQIEPLLDEQPPDGGQRQSHPSPVEGNGLRRAGRVRSNDVRSNVEDDVGSESRQLVVVPSALEAHLHP